MQKQPLRVWLYARTADARPGVLEEQLNSLYREAERRGYTVVNGGAEHRCAGDLDRPALFAMLALAGDVGCSGGPTLAGFVSGCFDGNLRVGILSAMIFPVLLLAGVGLTKKLTK